VQALPNVLANFFIILNIKSYLLFFNFENAHRYAPSFVPSCINNIKITRRCGELFFYVAFGSERRVWVGAIERSTPLSPTKN
jgi:hypothetical protein